MFEKLIFSLLFFEHGYLSNGKRQVLDIQNMSLEHPDLVNRVSFFLYLGPSFYFMTKKGNFYVIFSYYFSKFYEMKTKLYKNNLRQSSLYQNVDYMYRQF